MKGQRGGRGWYIRRALRSADSGEVVPLNRAVAESDSGSNRIPPAAVSRMDERSRETS